MNTKLKILSSFEEKKKDWEAKEKNFPPLKGLKKLPQMPGITKDTKRFLRLKSLFYLIRHDEGKIFLRYFFKRPFHYGKKLLFSYFKKKSYVRKGDFFLVGCEHLEDFEKKIQDPEAKFYLGFSYCHKPFECPSGRFTDQCVHDPENPVCRRCFIGKCAHLSKNSELLFIPTIHYIGEKMFDAAMKHKKVLFLITACEMSLEMFADWGNMIGIQGAGVRLDGRICNTMRAFELSEKGIKPGLTVVLDKTQEKILNFLRIRANL